VPAGARSRIFFVNPQFWETVRKFVKKQSNEQTAVKSLQKMFLTVDLFDKDAIFFLIYSATGYINRVKICTLICK
jgi:hypothetical protein